MKQDLTAFSRKAESLVSLAVGLKPDFIALVGGDIRTADTKAVLDGLVMQCQTNNKPAKWYETKSAAKRDLRRELQEGKAYIKVDLNKMKLSSVVIR